MEFMWTGTSQKFDFCYFCWFGLVWFGLAWLCLVGWFVCLFVCLFFCLSVFQIPSLSKFLTSLSSKLFEISLKHLGISQDSCIFFVFFEHVQSAETSSFPVKPTGCPAHRCLSTLPPWSCHLPSGLTGGLEEGAASWVFPFVFERKDQHIYIYIYIFFFIINTPCILKYIYMYDFVYIYTYTYIYIRILYLFCEVYVM